MYNSQKASIDVCSVAQLGENVVVLISLQDAKLILSEEEKVLLPRVVRLNEKCQRSGVLIDYLMNN